MVFNMLRFVFTVVAVCMAIDAADDIPEKCKSRPTTVHPHFCCKQPSVFDEKAMEKCGYPKPDFPRPPHPSGPRDGPHKCDMDRCLFKEMGLMVDEEKVDTTAAAAAFRSRMVEDPDWAGQVENVSKKCLSDLTQGPPEMCQPKKVFKCVKGTLFENCPAAKWNNTADCNTLREFMLECPHPHKGGMH